MGEGRETCKKMGITDRNKVDEPAACNTLSAARYDFAFMVRIQCTPGTHFVQPDIILTRSNFCRYAGSTGAQRNRPGGRLLSTPCRILRNLSALSCTCVCACVRACVCQSCVSLSHTLSFSLSFFLSLHTHTHLYTNTYIGTHVPTYLPTYVHAYIRTYMHACTYVYMYMYTLLG